MTGENGPATDETQHHEPKPRTSRLDANALIQGLERFRDCVAQRLDRLEALARERAAPPAAPPADAEPALRRRIAEYEEARLRLREQAERHEQEWRTALEQLERDRGLLAEAWEQLERERLEGTAGAPPQGLARTPPDGRGATPPPHPRPDGADPANDQVAHAILKQFHALRNDVRRNARQRGPL